MILACYNVECLVTADPGCANTGFHSLHWHDKLPSLLAFKALMHDLEGMKPTPLLLRDLPALEIYTQANVERLETAVASYYTQTFYQFFGHATVIPTCLP